MTNGIREDSEQDKQATTLGYELRFEMPTAQELDEARTSWRYHREDPSTAKALNPKKSMSGIVKRFKSEQGRAMTANTVLSASSADELVEDRTIGDLAVEYQILDLDATGAVLWNEQFDVGYSEKDLEQRLRMTDETYREVEEERRRFKERDNDKLRELDLYNDSDKIPAPDDEEALKDWREETANEHNSKGFVRDLLRNDDYHGAQVAILDLISDTYQTQVGQPDDVSYRLGGLPDYPVANIIPVTMTAESWGLMDDHPGLEEHLEEEMRQRADTYAKLHYNMRGHQECPSSVMYALTDQPDEAVRSAEISRYALGVLSVSGDALGVPQEYQEEASSLQSLKEDIRLRS